MPKVKIVSDPYRRSTRFYSMEADWTEIDESSSPNSSLLAKKYTEGFFPFKAREIVDELWEEYGDKTKPIEHPLEIVFEGPDDEWDEPEGADEAEDPATDGSFSTFSQFYDYINPKTARQKIATAGWWLEEQDGMESWRTFDVTKMLKEIGRPLGYVSGTLNQELRREDPIVDVMARSGESMQSHKAFALSQFGRAFIQGRLGD